MALNNGCIYESQILPGEAGRTLLAHLAATYRHSDCDTWRARLASGEVALDDRLAAGDERLRAGQRLVWARPPWDEPEVPLAFSVLHIDAALLVVDKPAGLPTLPAGGFLEHTLWALIRTQHPEASPVHRLGRFTSGLVLFARSHDAGASLSRAWRNHRVTKDYRALGAGRPAWTMREVTAPIGPVPHRRLGTVFGASEAGKPARSVLVARPGSGRGHGVRRAHRDRSTAPDPDSSGACRPPPRWRSPLWTRRRATRRSHGAAWRRRLPASRAPGGARSPVHGRVPAARGATSTGPGVGGSPARKTRIRASSASRAIVNARPRGRFPAT